MKDTTGKIIFSLLAGATAGIVAGLLLAPETGDETRSGLKKSAAKLGDDLNKLVQDNLTKLNDLKDTAANKVETVVGQVTGDKAPQEAEPTDDEKALFADTGASSRHAPEPAATEPKKTDPHVL